MLLLCIKGVDKTVKLWRVNGYQSEVVAADINPSENKSLLSDESKASSTVEGDEDEQKDDMNYLTSEVQSNLNLQSKSTTITTATAKKKYKKKNKGKSAVDNESSVSIDLIWSFNHNRKINIVKCFAPPVSVISNSVETDILPSLASGVFVIDAASSDVYIYKPAC